MKAAVLTAVGAPLEIQEVPISKPGPHEVLIRTAACGVCHSDLHFREGHYPTRLPTILGHESAGIVEAVGSEVRTVRPGDHVVTCLSAFCGHCEHCLTGHMSLCVEPELQRPADQPARLGDADRPMNQFLNLSAFAEQMLVHEHACVAIDRDMPFDRAAIIGCAVLTGYGVVSHTAKVRPGETVAVIGCGGVGLAAINGAAIAGAGRIIAVDRVAGKESLARAFGATDFIEASDGDSVATVVELTRGGVHHAIEAIGLATTAQDAFAMLRRGGTATIVGMIPVGQKLSIDGWQFLAEKKLQGSLMGSNHFPVDVPRLVSFYQSGKLRLDEMISRRVGLGDIDEAFEEMKTGQIARSVILFD
ncbi:Zn-dependent alcohol dehydrogenase [Sphingomonas ginkgonis]|uniref:Zn-dependent alcohol dehydrogenase n=1 Tax=Sphingomonas ginkgonis TaxID=2315330 RepID=A0A3R9X891_9SPHN|nr:Zn-dependent alcohol dehydrogenase [Sphingomonas ginkgonis]RST31123.1 Zn-dependent alcohol dehydrogenase [Sphingomonas ginkgonis]